MFSWWKKHQSHCGVKSFCSCWNPLVSSAGTKVYLVMEREKGRYIPEIWEPVWEICGVESREFPVAALFFLVDVESIWKEWEQPKVWNHIRAWIFFQAGQFNVDFGSMGADGAAEMTAERICSFLGVLTCRWEEKEQELESEGEGEVQHDVGARTTWWGLQLEAQLMKHEQIHPATLKKLRGKGDECGAYFHVHMLSCYCCSLL